MIQQIILAAVFLFLPCSAAACGICTFSRIDYDWPHVMSWSIGMMLWLFLLCLSVDSKDKTILPLDTLTVGVFIIAAFFIGFIAFGPFSFIPLCLLALYASVKSYLPNVHHKLSGYSKKGIKILSLTAFFCMTVGSIISVHTKKSRSDAEFILQWHGAYMSRVVLERLLLNPEKNEEQLRHILAITGEKDFAEKINEALSKMENTLLKQKSENERTH